MQCKKGPASFHSVVKVRGMKRVGKHQKKPERSDSIGNQGKVEQRTEIKVKEEPSEIEDRRKEGVGKENI
jgi:hypothetical protein